MTQAVDERVAWAQDHMVYTLPVRGAYAACKMPTVSKKCGNGLQCADGYISIDITWQLKEHKNNRKAGTYSVSP